MARIEGVELPRNKRIEYGLTYLFGIGLTRSQDILTKLKISFDKRVKDLVKECEKFAEESPYPDKNVMYDAVYEQEDYPFIQHKI